MSLFVVIFWFASVADTWSLDAEQWFAEGNRLSSQGKFEEAAEAYQKSIDQNPLAPVALCGNPEQDEISERHKEYPMKLVKDDLVRRYEVLKTIRRRFRAFIIDEAQDNSKFVEDVVRDCLKRFPNAKYIHAQSLESIHSHDAIASWPKNSI